MAKEMTSFKNHNPPSRFSLIQVDKDVTFVMDNGDIDFTLAVPMEKSIGLPHKTYSKRHPVAYEPLMPFRPEKVKVNGSCSFSPVSKKLAYKDSPKCVVISPEDTGKEISRKRPIRPDTSISKSPVPKKMRKEDTCIKMPTLKMNGRIPDKNKLNKNASFGEPSTDSDIEIIAEIKAGSSKATKKDFSFSCNGKEKNRLRDIQKRRNAKSLPSILKPCYPSTYDVPITEADIAPVIPSNSVIPDTGVSETNHSVVHRPLFKKWMYPPRTSNVSSSVQNEKICSAKESDRKHSDTSSLCESETKSPRGKVPRRELKQLYENLNEISWAREKGFQKMLCNSDGRHSERITAKVTDAGKSLRRLKAGSTFLSIVSNKGKQSSVSSNKQNKPSVSTNRQNKPSISTNRQNKPSVSTNRQNKPSISTNRQNKPSVSTNRQNKPSLNTYRQNKPSLNTNRQSKPSVSTNKLSKALVKKKSAALALKKAKIQRLKQKLLLKKNLKVKQPLSKRNRKVLNPAVKKHPQKVKGIVKRAQPNVHCKVKTVDKKKPMSASFKKDVKVVAKPKSKIGVKSQIVAGKSSSASALKKLVKEETKALVEPKSSFSGKIVKKVEFSNGVKFMKEQTVTERETTTYTTAMKKGSKLRVEVEPLEHTSLWSTSFCEAFSKYVIEQSSSQMEAKNKDSIKAMFEELMDSWIQNLPGSSKILKKKKPEEETLRSSVRQSECAFRYKEIVVKKHENYMQFILVPNPVKQNSLTIEAMKELREAFLLAKKDPNCRAVLLNSSGTFFCTGIDLSVLVGNGKKQAAEDMATSIRDLVLTLSMFTKPVIAAVNGVAVGFGVTLLTLCDVVLASDKATFCIPANRLGYLPEGAITLTLPQVVGSNVATDMMLYGRRYTAEQALRNGLVSEVLWHSNLMNEVIPRVKTIASQPLQVMEATKTMVRCQLWDRLKFQMESEWRLLPPLWLDAQCQKNMKQALLKGWLFD